MRLLAAPRQSGSRDEPVAREAGGGRVITLADQGYGAPDGNVLGATPTKFQATR